MNRLASATSPYLLQHKDNPVHWWEWEPEALADVRSERQHFEPGPEISHYRRSHLEEVVGIRDPPSGQHDANPEQQ